MEARTKQEVLRRLRSAAGHIEGIARMVEADAYCIDLIRQIQAVQQALARVNDLILAQHLRSCVTTAIRGEDPAERERVLQEILEVFAAAQRRSPFQQEVKPMTTRTFVAPNISCHHCVQTIARELQALPGVREVRGDVATRQVTVVFEPPATWDQIVATLHEIGYPPAE